MGRHYSGHLGYNSEEKRIVKRERERERLYFSGKNRPKKNQKHMKLDEVCGLGK